MKKTHKLVVRKNTYSTLNITILHNNLHNNIYKKNSSRLLRPYHETKLN